MKIALNGSSGKIGSAIIDQLCGKYEIVQIQSRLPHIDFIVSEIGDADVFINNANSGWSQVDLLIALYDHWKNDRNKHIINIGSRSAAPNVSPGFEYSTVKSALNHFSDLVRFKDDDKLCKITTINPGLVGHETMKEVSLNPSDIASTIDWILSLPKHVEISRLDIQHPTPYGIIQQMKVSDNENRNC